MTTHAKPACDWLDDFLAGELSEELAGLFASHLAACDECRQAASDWQDLRSLLKTATLQIESPNERLAERVAIDPANRLARATKRATAAKFAAAAFACVVLSVVLVTLLRWAPTEHVEVDNSASAWSVTVASPANVKLSGDVIGVPIDIGDPDVTVVWIYPSSASANESN